MQGTKNKKHKVYKRYRREYSMPYQPYGLHIQGIIHPLRNASKGEGGALTIAMRLFGEYSLRTFCHTNNVYRSINSQIS